MTFGQTRHDSNAERRAKAILATFVLSFVALGLLFLLDPKRSSLVHLFDATVIICALGVLGVLYFTKSLKIGFFALASVGLTLQLALLLLNGNRGGDLIVIVFVPILAIIMLGPKPSIPWLVASILTCLLPAVLEPHLPETTLDFFQSPENPTGSVFHAPLKIPVTVDSTTFFSFGAFLVYWLVYSTHTAMKKAQKLVEKQSALLEQEKSRAENLLDSVLPNFVTERLKTNDKQIIADDLDNVAVLFADVVGFTSRSSDLPASEVVALLNRLFSQFDSLVTKHNLVKIKTSGDAYMVAGGLRANQERCLEKIASLALAMMHQVEKKDPPLLEPIELRIGFHSGPAAAGLIGTNRRYYDIWGDTVNIASRLQSQGVPGKIQVCKSTRDKLKSDFKFDIRGEIDLKGKGAITTYFLTGKI